MPESVGIYYRDDEKDELYEFDKVAHRHQGGRTYSRSEAVRDAMDMYKMVLELSEDIGWDHLDERALRATVRQALLEQNRREES